MSERQVDQETVAIVQSAEDECRNKGMEDGRRYAATNASRLTEGGKAAGRCLLHVGLHRQILIDENAETHARTHARTGIWLDVEIINDPPSVRR